MIDAPFQDEVFADQSFLWPMDTRQNFFENDGWYVPAFRVDAVLYLHVLPVHKIPWDFIAINMVNLCNVLYFPILNKCNNYWWYIGFPIPGSFVFLVVDFSINPTHHTNPFGTVIIKSAPSWVHHLDDLYKEKDFAPSPWQVIAIQGLPCPSLSHWNRRSRVDVLQHRVFHLQNFIFILPAGHGWDALIVIRSFWWTNVCCFPFTRICLTVKPFHRSNNNEPDSLDRIRSISVYPLIVFCCGSTSSASV